LRPLARPISTQHAAPVGITFGLQRFLKRVQVNDDCIGLCKVYSPLAGIGAKVCLELSGPKVGKEKDVWRKTANAKGIGQMRGFESRTKRTQAHGDARRLGALGEVKIDALSLGRSASN
jgi:hypothetical protein